MAARWETQACSRVFSIEIDLNRLIPNVLERGTPGWRRRETRQTQPAMERWLR